MSTDMPERKKTRGAQLLRDRLRRQSGSGETAGRGIPVAPRDEPLPLSFAQRRMWVLDQLRPGGTEYLLPMVFRLRGELSAATMENALTELVRRHAILRTRYAVDAEGEPVQVVLEDPAVEFAVVPADESTVDALVAAESVRPFDLAEGPVVRARLFRLAPQDHVLAIVAHHIAADGWSGSLLARDLADLCLGRSLPEPELRYGDFAAWQRKHADDPRLERELGYWREQLDGLPVLELSTDRPRPPVWEPSGETVSFEIPAAVGAKAGELAAANQGTPFMVYLAAFWSLLHRYTGMTDFGVSTPIAGRNHPDVQNLVGLFVNTLVLRADLADDPTFTELVGRARTTAIDAYAHQDVPFERIVDALVDERDLSTHPLVGVNFILQNNEPFRFEAGALTGELMPIASSQAKFDLTWTLEEREDGSVAGEATFPHSLFDASTVRRMAGHFVRLLEAAVTRPDTRVADLPLLSEQETARSLPPAAGTAPDGPCLHEWFAEHVRARPDAIALTSGETHLGYAELDVRANRLAHRLRALGAGREDLVALCLPRGVNQIVGILATLKAGAAYLPLDPAHPADRIEFVVRDSAARVVVTEQALTGLVTADDVVVLDSPEEQARLEELPASAPVVSATPDDLAYVIYTSGSTGRPKGVQVTHANVVRLLTANEQEYGFGPDDVWPLFHSYAFDVSVWELWGTYMYGGRLVVVPQEVTRSPWDFAKLLADQGVTVLNQTPSAFRNLVELTREGDSQLDDLDLRLIIFAGEMLEVAMLAPWWERFGDTRPVMVNKYGITETTVHVTYRALSTVDLDGARSPIGRPMRDLTMYVLDERMRPVPVGVPGELYVGGPGVTRGYLGRPGLTAQRYVPDPFGPAGARLYRSGDKAQVLANGDINFLGRFDDQVKIRGFRIELGEVQACLADHPEVDTAVIVVHESAPGDRQLVAYVVPSPGAVITPGELRAHASDRLPGYMVPSLFISLDKLPLTVNGKIDRRALPAPDRSLQEAETTYVPPRTSTEEVLARLFAEILDLPRVGVHDPFFAHGGDSILAVRLVGRLRSAGFECSVQDLFRHQTVAELAAAGSDDPNGTEFSGTAPFALISADDRAKIPAGIADAYPMAQMQAGMVYEMYADPGRNNYHNITTYMIREDGSYDPAAVAKAVEKVIAEHEILRTSFDLSNYAEPMQLVHETAQVEFDHWDLRGLSSDEQRRYMDEFRARQRERLFDLAEAPLIRFHAHQLSDDRWLLSETECHSILDGWSHNSIISELVAHYRAIRDSSPAPAGSPRTVRFADFIAQEQRSLADPADHEFWADRTSRATPLLIPREWAAPDGPEDYHLRIRYRDLEAGLRKLADVSGASLKAVLLAAHVAVWHTVTGGEAVYSGLVCNGRTEVEGGDLVRGMFLNTVPFVSPAAGAGSWRELVSAVFAEEVALWPHRRYPMPEMRHRFAGGGRLFDVAFNYLNFHVLDREAVDTDGSTDVSLNEFPLCALTEAGDLILVAKSAWIGRRYTEMLAEMYRNVLEAMAADPDGAATAPLPDGECDRLVAEGRGPSLPTDDRSVTELVADRILESPDAVAVEAGTERLTYRELDARADVIAAQLAAAGARPGDLVGVALPRVPDLVASVVGILRLGATYVPADPGHPVERVTSVLSDAGVRIVLTTDDVAKRLPADGPRALVPARGAVDGAGPRHRPDPDALAYVVHTSGSTGRPKGVMVRHGALAARVAALRLDIELEASDVVVSVVPAIVDVWQLDVFAALASGAKLVLAGEDAARDPLALARVLRSSGATFMQASPTTWRLLSESGWTAPRGFRRVSGGESMGADLTARLAADDATLWDMYGPAEATVYCFGTRHHGDAAPRWHAAVNTRVYLLDDRLRPVPEGVAGEIHIAGEGLARGYLGRPATTAGVFLPDPYGDQPGARMYATGDLARRGRDGGVEILGRRDHQLKVRGFRVELGEIEHVLAAHPDVRAVVVQPVAGEAGPRLAAHLVLHEGTDSVAEIHEHAVRSLPAYMVPTYFVPATSLPRLANGKVDRAALTLSDAEPAAVTTTSAPPEGPVEAAIAATWAELLGLGTVGRDDDFFALGGHSLLMLRLVARLGRENGIEITFADILEKRTVRRLAEAVGHRGERGPRALYWLNTEGAGTPLFCLHPGGGSAHWFRELADEYAGRRPVGAFEWPGLHGDLEVPGTAAEIAARYLAEIDASGVEGPLNILGWCGSSGIAWEMARRLHESGRPHRLVLLDAFDDVVSTHDGRLLDNLDVLRRARKVFDSLGDADPGSRPARHSELETVLRELVEDGDAVLGDLLGDITGDKDLNQAWGLRLRSWSDLLEARTQHRFTEYAGRVDLIVCEDLSHDRYRETFGRSFEDYLDGWRRLAVGGLRVHRATGDHVGALRPPHVGSLAATVTTILSDDHTG